jgi:hypothetical protein
MRRMRAVTGLAVLLVSCATGGKTPAPVEGTVTEAESGAETGAATGARMRAYLSNGLAKIDEGSVTEGARQLVAALAERESLASAPREVEDIADKAKAELTRLGAALSLDSGMEWLDVNKNQLTGSVLDAGSPKGIQPSVILSYNMGRGKTLVAGAPILFEFVKGGGVLTASVSTNDYGQATCSIARLDSQSAESVIRASLVYTVNGFTYRMQGVERDFVYVPPSRRATILALERHPKGVNQPPIILDPVFNTLKGVAFDFSHYDGVLMGDAFMNVFSGDPKAIQALGMQKDVSYLVMVLNDCIAVNQVVLDGKTYNIFKSQTTATTRVIRVADGKILYSGAVQGIAGQGGDTGKALLDGFRKAAEEMAAKLRRELPEIGSALTQKW